MMIASRTVTVVSLWISVCTGYIDTADKKASIQYSVKNIAGDVQGPYVPAQEIVRRESPWRQEVALGPDTPLDRVKRVDVTAGHGGLKRRKRSPQATEPHLQRVKRQELVQPSDETVELFGEGHMLDRVKHDVPGMDLTEKHTKGTTNSVNASGNVDRSKRDLPSTSKVTERNKQESLGKPVELTKRELPSVEKSLERTKRNVPNANKPMPVELSEPLLKPVDNRDVKGVNPPPSEANKVTVNQPWANEHMNIDTQNEDTVAAIERDFHPLERKYLQNSVIATHDNVKSLAENLEGIRRRKREIRKAQVALDRQAETQRETTLRKRRELRHLREKMEQEGDWSAVIRG